MTKKACALVLVAAVVLLGGCGGSQPPINRSSLGSVTPAMKTTAPKKTGQDLIYVSGPTATYILSYPDAAPINSFQIEGAPGICSDARGDVFIPAGEEIAEYKHGGTTPIRMLNDKKFISFACAVDPTTESIAVTNIYSDTAGAGNVAIYQSDSKNRQYFTDPSIANYRFCAYDSAGNLYVEGTEGSGSRALFVLAELPKGSSSFRDITGSLPELQGQLQWDGQYLVQGEFGALYRISVSGSAATIVGTTTLRDAHNDSRAFSIYNHVVMAPAGRWGSRLGFWKYPSGGNRQDASATLYAKHSAISAITISKGH